MCVNEKVIIEDDGVGFDSHEASRDIKPESGFGLFSIEERMADFGGSLKIEFDPGKGCNELVVAGLFRLS